jgi:putative spermidine/putrescine transport system ATP-binding protein
MVPGPLVRFAGVQKTYDGRTLVIENLNLDIHRGEFLTLLGPSGSGKTTTLLLLAGFEHPTGGAIELEGKSLARTPPYRRHLGMVFQDYALFPHMTVAENVAFPLAIRRLPSPEIARRIAAALDMVKLGGLGERKPSQLSGGQQQRVALARALVYEPRLVLMDEPLGALDKQLREQMQLEIKHIQRELGITVVYVTHDQTEALVMSDRIAVFNEGRICQLDTPAELYERPRSAFVAQFIGENNRLAGKVVEVAGDVCRVDLEIGGTVVALPINVAGVGARTVLSVRPERILLDPAPEGSCANVFEARVTEVTYLGDHVRVALGLRGGPGGDVVAKVPIAQVPVRLEIGVPLRVGWAATSCRALEAD